GGESARDVPRRQLRRGGPLRRRRAKRSLGAYLHASPDEARRVYDGVELPIESRRRDFERIAMRNVVGDVEQRRDLAGNRLALVQRHGRAVGALQNQAQDGELPGAARFDREQPATLLRG